MTLVKQKGQVSNHTMSNLTQTSQNFLKAATCAPDNDIVARIPDGSGEHTFTQKFSRQISVSCPVGQTTLIVCTPTLPMACYSASYVASAGGMPLTGSQYPVLTVTPTDQSGGGVYTETKTEFSDWFQTISQTGNDNSSNISSARLVSLSAEMQCVTNAFNQYGTIQVFKTPLQLVPAPGTSSGGNISDLSLLIVGANGLIPDAVSTGAFMAPVRDGAYSVSMNRNGGAGNYEFSNIIDNTWVSSTMYATIAATSSGVIKLPFKGVPLLWDNHFDTIVFKVIVPAGVPSAQSFILKNWVAVEMATTYGSFLHGIAQAPPPRDLQAFKLYGAIQANLPQAVPSRDNPNFWADVLGLVKSVSGVASMIPGPIGNIASGVHAVSQVLSPSGNSNYTKFKSATHSVKIKRRKGGKAPKQQPKQGRIAHKKQLLLK